MKLIDILVRELPKRGGWPDGAIKYKANKNNPSHGEAMAFDVHGNFLRGYGFPVDCDGCEDGEVVMVDDYQHCIEKLESAQAKTKEPKTTWKYIKGSEKDFVGAPDSSVMIVGSSDGDAYAVDIQNESIKQPITCISTGSMDGSKRSMSSLAGMHSIETYLEGDTIEIIAQREPVAEWPGVGLPPVGEECEFRKHSRGINSWIKVKVMYMSEFTAVMRELEDGASGEEIHHPKTLEFRPLRTEADKKRDEAIDELVRLIGITPESAAICYDVSLRMAEK